MAASDKFTDKEHEQSVQPHGRYVRQRCFAAGCKYHAVLITNPDTGDGLCEYHSCANDATTWPRLTSIIQRIEFVKMNNELFKLNEIRHRNFDECAYQMSQVQKAGLACGMDYETLRIQSRQVWMFGQQCIEKEVPAAYYYRVSMAFLRYVVNLAKPVEQQEGPDYVERGMMHIDTALKLLRGELMPAHIRPVEEAA